MTRVRPIGLSLEVQPLETGWEVAAVGARSGIPPSEDRIPARVPGTVAGAYRDAGREIPAGLDDVEWSFRTRFDAAVAGAGEEVVLRLDGIATVADVLLDGAIVATGESMFLGQVVDITHVVGGSHELEIRCRPLSPLLAESGRPRARWRAGLVADGNLRWFRTSLLGRAPGFSAGPPVVGPWRSVSIERRRGVVVDDLRVQATLEGDEGRLEIGGLLRSLGFDSPDRVLVELDGPSGRHRATIDATAAEDGSSRFDGTMRIPDVATWWPHTHGAPALHSVRLEIASGGSTMTVDAGRVGFRTLAAGPSVGHDVARDGLDLQVNGVSVFARGAVWTPVDPIGVAVPEAELRASLELVVAAGMNMLRVPGIGLYESDAFHDLCDELGILLWQDLMFANLDYPFVDDGFRTLAEREAAQVVGQLAGRPSTAVVCGNSEVEQQVAMLGLDPLLGRDAFYVETLPAIVAGAGSDAVVVPSTPFGGDLPFRPDRGIANYYGVGGYRRPLSDARTAGVRFAAECLAFSNLPDDATLESDRPDSAGVPRDTGADWDFADVRDHYLQLIHGVDPVALRRDDPERYLALSRAVSGEVMAEVFGEWRRAASTCRGGLVLWWRDVIPGAGWGLLDRDGRPKAALHHLRRALAPIAVWMTDEGLGGIAIHVANDRPEPLIARLRLALYRDGEIPVGDATAPIELPGHGIAELNVETLLGRFVDASWAYRFGPPAQQLVVASLETIDGDAAEPLSHAVRFPAGRPAAVETVEALGLRAEAVTDGTDDVTLQIDARRLVYGLRIEAPGWLPDEDALSIESGHARRIRLRPAVPGTPFRGGRLTANNLAGAHEIALR